MQIVLVLTALKLDATHQLREKIQFYSYPYFKMMILEYDGLLTMADKSQQANLSLIKTTSSWVERVYDLEHEHLPKSAKIFTYNENPRREEHSSRFEGIERNRIRGKRPILLTLGCSRLY